MPRSPLLSRHDLPAALGLLTRLPVPVDGDRATARGAAAAWAYPLAGAVVGALAGAVHLLAGWLGLPPPLAAGLAVAASVIVTGALHEDGLADTADGLWGGWTRDRRLEIMRDSRIGTYGMLALILSLSLRTGALAALPPAMALPALIACGALSRAAMVAVWTALPPARRDGLSAGSGQPGAITAALALALGTAAAMLACGGPGVVALLMGLCGAALVALAARAKIGGQTGDILGAAQQLADIAGLLALVTLLGS
ncbi:adenosylcobinamide-GDP ribazoletransferase [Meridianimarinicoccus sp. RP-17]|uniref:adenosylcobinamide-GDP ribazoletransferase n=1 Tax=Meridianimarinicoccus zhengii TaxID=2056810 RepID=UPI000DAB8B7F|nr:adenosylcobinamide-GDP ribazoletransferase [Phycocomes zhengii]